MVDADVEIPDVVAKGKLLTLTTSEALTNKVADFTADTLSEALAVAGARDADIRLASQTWAETFVRFLTNPVVSSLLMTVGMLGLLVEIRTPGFALPGTVGLLSLALFFWGHWIVQLAGWEELLLVAAGVILPALELFVIPGFGVAGIGGIVALAAGLGLTPRRSGVLADVGSVRFDSLVQTRATGRVLKRTEQHAVSEQLDCDRTVIRQARNLEEHRGLPVHTE